MKNNYFDVVIIGAGPIGLTCGIEAAKRNYNYLIIEKGCLVNSVFHYPTNMTFFSTSERLEIGDVPFISHGDKPTRREALEYFRRVKKAWNLKINDYEEALEISKSDNVFHIKTSKAEYTARNVIIASGFFDKPNLLNVPGEELPKVYHYFTEAHPFFDHKIVVVGAANSAVDVALEIYRRGAEVTMIIREDKIRDSVKYWVKPDIENRIKENSIKAYFNSNIIEIRKKEIVFESPEGIKTIENDFVFAMTGYHADIEFLRKTGIGIAEDKDMQPIYDPETFQTHLDGLYLAGVVCCGYDTGRLFIENSRYHAANIFASISTK
jgi:putative YpdA family bacillithiol system oxidoreductase